MSTNLQQVFTDCQQVAKELLSQPDLLAPVFDDEGDGVQETAASVGRYTGARSTLDDARLLRVGALRLLGASDREIERACGVTRRSIPVMVADLERSGRLTPLKERLGVWLGDNAERSAAVLRVLLDRASDGEVSADLAQMIKSVATAAGITTEKFLLTTGAPTEIVETRVAAGRAEIEAWWSSQVRDVTPITTAPADSASVAFRAGCSGSDGVSAADAGCDAGRVQGSGSGGRAGSDGPERGAAGKAVENGGRGGCGPAGPTEDVDDSTGFQNSTKGAA